MKKGFHTLTLTAALDLLAKKEISIQEIYRDVQESISEQNPDLHAYLFRNDEAVRIAQKYIESPLRGIPIAVKDNFLTVGMPTTASSNVLKGFMPPYESTVTKKLQDAGGVIIGKTNMDAWAHGSSTETSDFGLTKNPRNPDYLPGGSSGGSAAAVAADMCIAALGTETAGSIRQPAAWCGVVGLKPTYGRVSRAGVVAMGSSLDCPGPIGKTVEDCALLLEVMAGKDPYDATTADIPVPDFTKTLKRGVKGMKIGICYMDYFGIKETPMEKAVTKAGEVFKRLGAYVDSVPLADRLTSNAIIPPNYAIGVYTVIQRSEVSSNLARYDGIRYGNDRSNFGEEAKRRIMLGTFALSKGYADKYYLRAQQIRSLYIQNFKELFKQYDLLISLSSPGVALPIGASAESPMFGELQDMLVEPSSLAGLPGVSVPCFYDSSLPKKLYLGLNIMANYWQEEKMLAAAYAFEQNTQWNSWIKK